MVKELFHNNFGSLTWNDLIKDKSPLVQIYAGKPHLVRVHFVWIWFSMIYNLGPYPTIVRPNFDLLQFFKMKYSQNYINTALYASDMCLQPVNKVLTLC